MMLANTILGNTSPSVVQADGPGGDAEELQDHVLESMYVDIMLLEEVLRSLGPLRCCSSLVRKHATIIELPIFRPQQVLKLRA